MNLEPNDVTNESNFNYNNEIPYTDVNSTPIDNISESNENLDSAFIQPKPIEQKHSFGSINDILSKIKK